MKTLICKLCSKSMGEMEKGKLRLGLIVLCKECWEKADIAIQMADLARSQTKNYDMPEFFNDLFKK